MVENVMSCPRVGKYAIQKGEIMQTSVTDRNTLELDNAAGTTGLVERVLGGQVVVLRQALQQLDLFDSLVQASLEGIRNSMGGDVAERAQNDGFDRIHEFVEPRAIPEMTDAVYETVARIAPEFLDRFVSRVFPGERAYYFENSPNVRFHIPYDLAASHRRQYDEFARDHGQGKIAPHGLHRYSWLDCPDNALNLWIAVGPVQPGNGLSIFRESRYGVFVPRLRRDRRRGAAGAAVEFRSTSRRRADIP